MNNIKCVALYFLILKKYTNKSTHEAIKNNPPTGVMNPITLKLKGVKSFVANKYIEPENNNTPIKMSLHKIDFWLGLMCVVMPIKNNKKAWYI